MALIYVCCIRCSGTNVSKYGKTHNGKQRYICLAEDCKVKTFILDYQNVGCLPEVKEQIIDMTMNGSGIRDIARVLGVDKNTVLSEIKKKRMKLVT